MKEKSKAFKDQGKEIKAFLIKGCKLAVNYCSLKSYTLQNNFILESKKNWHCYFIGETDYWPLPLIL